MCPVCLGNLALLAAGASSSGGLTAFALGKFLKKENNKRKNQNENCKDEIELQNRLIEGVGGGATKAAREGEGVDARS
jgi:membrane protein YqaA with SNARE-associated domain